MNLKDKLKKIVAADLGWIDDALTIIIDLTHIEIHSWKSFNQTKDKDFLDIYNHARVERSELLSKVCDEKILKDSGELWCINKHSLRVIGGYVELGSRELSSGNRDEAMKYFEKASNWLGVFLIKNKLKRE